MLQLFFTLGSPPSRAVLQTIRILGLEVEAKTVDLMKGENLTPAFIKMNGLHQVPVLVDGDTELTESRAIMAYFVNSRMPGSDLYPSDPRKRAEVDKMLYFECVNFFELCASILRPIFFFDDNNIPSYKITKLKETLKYLNDVLEENLFVAGNNPTIADVASLSTFIMFQSTFKDFGEISNSVAWFERCQKLVGFEENLAGKKAIESLMEAKGMSPISLK